MAKVKWQTVCELFFDDIKTTIYEPEEKTRGIRIESLKRAIRLSSGTRYETIGIYVNKDGKLLNKKYDTFAEATAAAERMMK